ncbi:hypothetical protein GNI_046170 [Gregarina niphandrodes]|uniref:Uncharacterized protein n=1 Tax=Gregarina niphandrodes TaxID=110365 RepID=A0A023B9U1_GRENI|nr:hypothetical protein GNI_046170 [Gregarina niphandrodes]EZG75641.1 hypothetical protein GNI_046170 [Gregarina niphandrodes]|eukprot:XP_011129605.1 hypothetical protein GNI_046170 [Gregarina niphandrodes]
MFPAVGGGKGIQQRCLGLVLAGVGAAGGISEMDWFGSFWRPLKVDEFEAITGQMPAESWKRVTQWRSLANQLKASDSKFDPALWTWIGCERKLYALYTPTLPRLTTFGDELFRWNANAGAGSDLNARVETVPGADLPEKNASSRGARFDYDAYCKLRSTLSETGWKSLRRVTPAAFDKCNLAYVEVGAAISECFEEPYGAVDPQVRKSVVGKLGCGLQSVRLRNWLTGCLLQHAEGSLTDLAVFCAHVLKFAPLSGRIREPGGLHDPVAVAEAHLQVGLRCKKLECLRDGYLKFDEYAERFDSGDETRLELWKQRLANQPTVSVSSFGEMQQPKNDKPQLLPPSPVLKAGGVEEAWASRYWDLVSPEEHACLSRLVSPVPERRREAWRSVALRLSAVDPGQDGTDRVGTSDLGTSDLGTVGWTMTRSRGGERPLYIPELGTMNAPAKELGYFSTGYDGYCALYNLLGRDNWAKLRTIKPIHFKSCKEGYLRLAAEFHQCFVAPFGILDGHGVTSLTKQMRCDYRIHRDALRQARRVLPHTLRDDPVG